MAGRNRMPRYPDNFRGFHNGPRPVLNRGPGPPSIHTAALEEEIEIIHREMQQIISENRIIIDDNAHLETELTAAKDEIHRLSQVIPKLQAEKEAQTRELIERGMKLEAELRASEPVRAEVIQLRAEVKKLNTLRQELTTQIQGLTKDVNRLQAENQQLSGMKADIDGMQKELVEARRAFEYEKKAKLEQAERNRVMEQNLVSMARDIEKLRAELMNAERRAQGFGGYGSPEMRHAGGAHSRGYRRWGPYDNHGPYRR